MKFIHILLGVTLTLSRVEGQLEQSGQSQGQGYAAKVVILPEESLPEVSAHKGPRPSHLKKGQHATLESLVDKIYQGLLHPKPLPSQEQRQHEAEDAQTLEELRHEARAAEKRKARADRILKVFRVKRLLTMGQTPRRGKGQRRRHRKWRQGHRRV